MSNAKSSTAVVEVVKSTFPVTPGGAIDHLYKLRAKRKAVEARVAEMKSIEDELEEHIFGLLNPLRLEAARGKSAQASISTRIIPQAEDWDAVYAYVRKQNRFDLLHKRLTEGVVKEMWEAGEEVPGVGRVSKRVLHLTKV